MHSRWTLPALAGSATLATAWAQVVTPVPQKLVLDQARMAQIKEQIVVFGSHGPSTRDDCSGAVAVSIGSVNAGDTTGASSDGATLCGSAAGAGSPTNWYSFVGDGNTVTVSLCGSAYDSTLHAYCGTCPSGLVCIAGNDDFCGLQSQISWCTETGVTYYLRIGGFGGDSGPYTLAITSDGSPCGGPPNCTPPPPPDWDEAVNGGGDAGETPGTVQTCSGSGALDTLVGSIAISGDADAYLINICNPANFSATTVNDQTGGDTQLWLLDPATNLGIVHNDDDPSGAGGLLSVLTNTFTSSLPAGNYVLVVSRYNSDPIDAAGGLLWSNTPFNDETAPDGPAAGNAWADYNNVASATGAYRVNLSGACLIGGAPCPCDLNNDNVVDISDLALLLANFGTAGPVGDINASGVVDISDLALILACFGTNCP